MVKSKAVLLYIDVLFISNTTLFRLNIPLTTSSKWEFGTGSRLRPTLRGSINSGAGGRPSRTAKLNWFRKYVRAGELDRAIRIEMDKALHKSNRRTATRGFG